MMNLSIVHSSMVLQVIFKGASTEELYEAIKVVYQGGAMINPNIASKVFQIFSQMAKTNFSIAVDEGQCQGFEHNRMAHYPRSWLWGVQ